METLVLGIDCRPLEIIPWQRAMVLLGDQLRVEDGQLKILNGRIQVMEEYADKQVRTVAVTFNMPSVIRFMDKVRNPKRAVKFSRFNIWLRDKGSCQYCGTYVPRDQATYDHVIPRAQGGRTNWENIVNSCQPCNQKKRDRTPAQAGMQLLSKPAKPTRLPDGPSFMLTYRRGMPPQWANWLQDQAYWTGKLHQD